MIVATKILKPTIRIQKVARDIANDDMNVGCIMVVWGQSIIPHVQEIGFENPFGQKYPDGHFIFSVALGQ